MGSSAHVLVHGGPDGLLDHAVRRIEQLEERWSRFRPDSEVSRMNASSGCLTIVSPDTYLLVERSVEAWQASDGAFDPTVLGALIDLGYDTDLAELPCVGRCDRLEAVGHDDARTVADARPAAGCGGIELFPALPAVRLPAGIALDPGGIGKGLAADLVSAELTDRGARGALVGLGGDLRVRGAAPGGHSWAIAIEDPFVPDADLTVLAIDHGAVATSSTLRRRWHHGGRVVHHVIDPATGRPAIGDLVAATVVADDCWRAEAAATALLVTGPDRPPIEAHWLAVHTDGRTRTSRALEAVVGPVRCSR
jgi:thiamine biosynthesis lipoprotein